MEANDINEFQSSLSRRQVLIAVAGTMLAMFLSMLYMTVVSTAMPRIIMDLGGFSEYTWVFTSYFIAEVIVVLVAGKLSDMYGRKWFYIISLAVFVTGSFLSGISQNMTQLIIFRGFQGIGGGGIMSLSFIVIADLFPPAERGKWQGALSIVMAVATVVGPTLGGYLTDYFSWRWCFFINIPMGIAIGILFAFFYPHFIPAGQRGKIDYAGIIMTVFAIVPLMLALTWGGTDYSWFSPIILGLFTFSLLSFIVFFIVEGRAGEPIMPRYLFRNRVVLVSAIAVLLMGFAFTTVITFVPLYFQGVMGTSATTSGNSLIPMMLSVSVSSFLCGQIISRKGGYYRLLGSIGFLVMSISLFMLSRMTVATGYSEVVIYSALTGIGAGLLFPLHTLAVQNTVSYALMGTATSMLTWLRTIGNLLGLSIVGAVLNNRFNTSFFGNLSPEVKEFVTPDELASIANNPQALVNPEAQSRILSLFESAGTHGEMLFEQLLTTLQYALNDALTYIFLVGAVFAIAGMIVNFFLKGIPSHRSK